MKLYQLLSASMLLVSLDASATLFEYSSASDNGVYNSTYQFNTDNDIFNLSFDFSDSSGVDGFWFVVNDGPSPQASTQGDLAIFYSDLTDIWAYQYAGFNRGVNGSYTSTLLEKWENITTLSSSSGTSSINFELDVAQLNGLGLTSNWAGLAFDESIGTWLHTTRNTFDNCERESYKNKEGDLTCFTSNNWLGWDRVNQVATAIPAPASIPEPSSLALLGLAFLGMGIIRCRKTL